MADGTGLGTRIRARRKTLGLTLTEVAERAGLSNQYVSNLENSHRTPSLATLRSIATALGQTVTDLLGHDTDTAHVDLVATALADSPQTLLTFTRSPHFRNAVGRLADEHGINPEDLHTRLTIGMAIAPRHHHNPPTDHDWRRLLDAYTLILRDDGQHTQPEQRPKKLPKPANPTPPPAV